MPDVIRLEMEDDKEKHPAIYKTKWLGLPASLESRNYKDWAVIDALPHEARLKRYGLDFGYTNDPTAVVAVYEYNGGFILDEVVYQKGLSNERIASALKVLERAPIVADSAEPKSIDELKLHALLILPSQKGPGSVNQGIQYIQGQRISITKRSVNLLGEYYSYLWMSDKDGKIINEPTGGYDHALDAVRYALSPDIKVEYKKREKPPNNPYK